MKAIKQPSGNYRVQKMINGKSHSITFDHKPTQKEINDAIQKKVQSVNGRLTFENASRSYIDARSHTLSPATIKEYNGIVTRLTRAFLSREIDDITTHDVQLEINRIAKDKAPKTVRNYHGFIASVLGEFRPELVLKTKLPQKEVNNMYIPTKEDIRAILEEAKGTQYEVAILLGCASLRRGEICALTMDDIDGNVIHITKDMVYSQDKKWVIKPPKTTSSVRDVIVPDQVIEVINKNGLYKGHPNSISDWMDAAEKRLGLNHFSLHKCRHYFASAAHEAGIPDADIMKAGGWKTDYVMKNVYRHSLAQDNSAATSAVFKNII